ncbi:hypothetical protein [Micromonospora sp. CPCC 206061]|uniref:hypothetical protein n=1 Tax=Micromonospora sp. CPCC 206061 TaxID=3122410 RepID=UPI002FF1783C
MRWLEARRQRAELLRVVTEDVERARAVFGRLLLIRSVGQLRMFCGPDKARGMFPGWTYIPVASFFIRCPYRQQVSVLSEEDRAIARELDLEPHLDPDRDLKSVRKALRRVVDAYTGASVSFNTVEAYKDPDLAFDEQATRRRYDDLDRCERHLSESICALPGDLPDTALTSQVLSDALHRTAGRMGGRELGYSPYATAIRSHADRWPQWLAIELVERAGPERLSAANPTAVRQVRAAVSGTLHSLIYTRNVSES